LLYAEEISPHPDNKGHNGEGENKEKKHNPTLITGEDFAAPTFIVRRFAFPVGSPIRDVFKRHVPIAALVT
jgi:hypothetical protein